MERASRSVGCHSTTSTAWSRPRRSTLYVFRESFWLYVLLTLAMCAEVPIAALTIATVGRANLSILPLCAADPGNAVLPPHPGVPRAASLCVPTGLSVARPRAQALRTARAERPAAARVRCDQCLTAVHRQHTVSPTYCSMSALR
jgi:hypothetical protein